MTQSRRWKRLLPLLLGCSAAALLPGCGGSPAKRAEGRVEQAFDFARGNPLTLRAFLVDVPKGAELHYHLSGGVYAETFIRDGAEDHLCVNLASRSFVKKQGTNCAKGDVPAESALQNQQLFDTLVDAFSMRGFVATPGVTGHDQFFDTFPRFGAV